MADVPPNLGRRLWAVVGCAGALLLLVLAHAREVASAPSTFTSAVVGSGAWNSAGSWNCVGPCDHAFPIDGDTANISGADEIALAANEATSNLNLTALGAILELNAFTLTINGTSTWTSQVVQSTGGGGVLSQQGVLTLAGVGTNMRLRTATLANLGTTVHSGTADMEVGSNALVANSGLYDLQSDAGVVPFAGTVGAFTNTASGVLQKSTGGGTSVLNTNVTNAGGTIQVQSGTLELFRALRLEGGTYHASAGATLDLSRSLPRTMAEGTLTGSGAGAVLCCGATGFQPTAAGATLDFPGNLFQWTGGRIETDLGPLTNVATSVITLSGSGLKELIGTGGQLVNLGTIKQGGTGNLSLGSGVGLTNAGTYDVQSDADVGAVTGRGRSRTRGRACW
jgi:hypothetical protein